MRISSTCRPSSRSEGVENIEVDDRSPIEGRGIISGGECVSGFRALEKARVPELNGTTDENGEYGSASSTVSTFVTLRFDPFVGDAPFGTLAMPFRLA